MEGALGYHRYLEQQYPQAPFEKTLFHIDRRRGSTEHTLAQAEGTASLTFARTSIGCFNSSPFVDATSEIRALHHLKSLWFKPMLICTAMIVGLQC